MKPTVLGPVVRTLLLGMVIPTVGLPTMALVGCGNREDAGATRGRPTAAPNATAPNATAPNAAAPNAAATKKDPAHAPTSNSTSVGSSTKRAGSPARPPTRTRNPTAPDPRAGSFTLAQALAGDAGLQGKGTLVATLHTSKGELTCDLDAKAAPNTVANFVGLARGTRPWWDAESAQWVTRPLYDGTTFHRTIQGFMIQGGDPLGDGTGGVGYVIDDEIPAGATHDRAGQLCMANRGPNTNGSQFFITDGAAPHLDGGYTIFGQCTPTDLVSKIARLPLAAASGDRPVQPVPIEKMVIQLKRSR